MSETQTPREEPAHDVLAADEFAVPARDPSLRHDPVQLPEDPSGIAEPHDVLAAEEFAMPATPRCGFGVGLARRTASRTWRPAVAVAAALVVVRRLLRRRGS